MGCGHCSGCSPMVGQGKKGGLTSQGHVSGRGNLSPCSSSSVSLTMAICPWVGPMSSMNFYRIKDKLFKSHFCLLPRQKSGAWSGTLLLLLSYITLNLRVYLFRPVFSICEMG